MNTLKFYANKKVFVTGHTGFKGTWLSRILLLAGAAVTGYSLQPPTKPSLYDLTGTEKEIDSIHGDIRDRSALEKAVRTARPEIVFHLAAQPLVRLSYNEPAVTYETNVMGTVNILEAVRACDTVRSIVNVTTDKVYQNREWLWGYREDERLCGFDPYSNSKSCSELVTYSYKKSFFSAESSPAISTVRSGNVIGGGDNASDRIIPDCIRAVQSGIPITIRNPNSTRPYQHVLECLSGYLLLAQKQYEHPEKYCSSYNFGPDDSSCVTTGQLAELFCSLWGEGAEWKVQGDNGPHEANYLKLDCTKARKILGWTPYWDIHMAVKQVVEWHKSAERDKASAAVTDRQIIEYFKE
ncbi:CDP-glucose 4,6-dehydratase [Marispirochaeta aestuarii]|uniref:CDP-glucose 4,6-dehydratase n=1 Tax=Marispirochaeta aestuarii TaxID=1963862 RepID=UPI0029C8A129|nr:CDP-glucose 4,6-dehydratase [Marispirochaeta aestuarii]